MMIILTILHVLICFALMLAVLLQAGKGSGLASALGGGMSSSSVLGGRSAATILTKATTILATAFMVSCLLQSMITPSTPTDPTTAAERMMGEGEMPVVPPLTQPGFFQEAAPAAEGEAGGAEGATEPAESQP